MTLGIREPVASRPLVAAACVRINPDDPGVADVARLLVAPGRCRPGLGSLLLRAAEHRLPAQVRELWLQINPADAYSRRLYAQHGYRQAAHHRAAGNHTAHLVKPRRLGAGRSAQ